MLHTIRVIMDTINETWAGNARQYDGGAVALASRRITIITNEEKKHLSLGTQQRYMDKNIYG